MTLTQNTQRDGTPGKDVFSQKKIPLTRPFMNDAIKRKVCDVLESGYLTEGPVTGELEKSVGDYIGCKHAIAVTSCTTGLEMALRALDVGPGDEVIVPDYTYPATADVVAIVGATIVLVDVSQKTMLIDYDKLEQVITKRTKAVIPVSLFGNPLDYDRLNTIKKKHGIHILEDSACSIGASYKGVKVGNLADISVFSLHPRKFITTGEGGIITTNNPRWAEWMVSYKHFGIKKSNARSEVVFERIGSNYKISDVLSAIGLEQMRVIETLTSRRSELASNYISLLRNIDGISLPVTTEQGEHSYQSFCVYVRNRDEVLQKMRDMGIEVQIGTYALHDHPAFAPSFRCLADGKFSGSQYVYQHCLALPLYHELRKNDQEYVVFRLKSCLT